MDPMLNNTDPTKRSTAVMDIQPTAPAPASEDNMQLAQAPVETEPAQTETIQSDNSSTAAPVEPLAAAPKQSSHGKTPILAIVLAVIIAGSLAAFAIFTYADSKDKKTATSPTTQQAATQPKAAPADVDSATTDVDAAMSSVDENTDFDQNTMSDAALGL